MSNIRFSVIVPVYNVEKYVDQCLKSITKQTYKDFEVIIINDGSTDNSLSICEKYASNDDRFKIISQENKGLSIARHVGALEAKNEYIINIDSDDWVDSQYFEEMAKIIDESHADLVCMNHFENENKLFLNKNFNDVLLSKEDIKRIIFPYLFRNKRYEYFTPTAWAKAYKRELFTKFTCTSRIQLGEDGSVTIPAIINANSIYLSSKAFYHYRIADGSMVWNKKPRTYSDPINVYEHLSKFVNLDEEDFKLQLDRFVCHLAFNCSVTQFYGRKYKEAKRIILENLDNAIIKNAISHIDASGFKGKLMRHALRHRSIFLMKLYSYIM